MLRNIEKLQNTTRPNIVIVWLISCFVAVAIMIVIGGMTRLTDSGLSMIEWRLLLGIVPPLTAEEWERVFKLYQKTSEFQIENPTLSLNEFKTIFWWEYVHRLWGRLIGVLFIVGMLFLIFTKKVGKDLAIHLVCLLVLGGMQGFIGWWMVQSGLVDRTDVSQYRLVTHLGIAFIILGYLLYLLLSLGERVRDEQVPTTYSRYALVILGVVSITILSGGLTAGLKAGHIYNTWPLIDGGLMPEDAFSTSPLWLDIFENASTVQFDHRFMAYLTCGLVISLWLKIQRESSFTHAKHAVNTMLCVLILQAILGVLTLLLVVPIYLAIAHQIGAIALFSSAVWSAYALRQK